MHHALYRRTASTFNINKYKMLFAKLQSGRAEVMHSWMDNLFSARIPAGATQTAAG